jgi:hypothetical protein
VVGAAGLEPATTCLEGTQLLFPLTDLNLNAFCKQSQDQNVLGSGWTMYPVEASERGVDRAVSEISNRICSCLPRRGMSCTSIFQTTKPLVTPKVVARSDKWVVEPELQGHGSARLIRVTKFNPLPNSLGNRFIGVVTAAALQSSPPPEIATSGDLVPNISYCNNGKVMGLIVRYWRKHDLVR